MATDRARKLRRLFADWVPFPDGGRGFLVNTGSEHLAGLALAARGAENVEAVERDLIAARRLEAALRNLSAALRAVARSPQDRPDGGEEW